MFIYSGIAVIWDSWILYLPVSFSGGYWNSRATNDNIALKMSVAIISLGLYIIQELFVMSKINKTSKTNKMSCLTISKKNYYFSI